MKRLLIVDDEKIERNGIKMLLKSMDVDIEILEAPNGKKALQIIKERRIDFMLTDIKMPFMTGLELTKAVREINPDIQIAIFSGFGEFTYAQEAIKYDVTNYILKPVNPKEFKATMEKMILNSENREQEERQKKKDGSFRNKYLLQRYLFTGKDEYLDKIMLRDPIGEFESISQIQNVMLLEAEGNFFEEHGAEVVKGLKEQMGRKIEYLDLNANQILLIFYKSASDNYARIAGDIQKFLAANYNVTCYIAVSSKINDAKNSYKAYQEAEMLLENKFYRPDTKVFFAEEDVSESDSEYVRVDYQKRLKEDIRMKDFMHLWNDYQMLKEMIYHKRMDSQMYVKFIFSELIKDLYVGMGIGDSPKMKEKIEHIYQSSNLTDICAYVEDSIREFERLSAQSDESVRSDVNTIKNYISTHFGEDLSTDMLAAQIYLSPGYLSYIFKKETGMNLSRYIKECRMEKAKKLLRDTNMKITQICKEVGFSNVSYFCQSFRDYSGVSPEKYRKGETEDE